MGMEVNRTDTSLLALLYARKDMSAFRIGLLSILIMLVWHPASAQAVINVPVDQPTIQSGIDAAKNGDIVLVSPGTYNENINFNGKAITVTSGATSYSGAATTIINAVQAGAVVNFLTHEPSSAVLNGFTIQGAFSMPTTTADTAGIAIDGSSPTISNNIIQQNIACGVLVDGTGSPTLEGDHIWMNRYPNATDPPSSLTCGPLNGIAAGTGLGINVGGVVTVRDTIIEKNTANPESLLVGGSGIYLYTTTELVLVNNIIQHNIGAAGGESALFDSQDTFIGGFVLLQNRMEGTVYLGGDFEPPYPSLTMVNNTVYGLLQVVSNFATDSVIENNIDYSAAPDTYSFECSIPSQSVQISYDDSYTVGGYVPGGCPLDATDLETDPEFLNPGADNFHTQRTSPIVAAGNINAPGIQPEDMDKKNRTVCGTIDMGVYEVHPQPPIALTVSPNPAPGQSSVTLTATLTGNCNTPTGLITFMDGSTVLGTAPLDGSAVAMFSTSFLFVGTHLLAATYPGDFNFARSTSNTITEVITGPPTTTILNSVTPNPALPLQPIAMTATVSSAFTTPTGTITFMTGGQVLATTNVAANGSASATISTLGAGTYPIIAVYGGSTEYASSTSNTILEVVNGAPTTTSLTSAPNPSNFGQTVTFTANVAAPQSTTTPTGSVTFMDGANVLGSAPLSTSDVAQFSTASLAAGSHNITAIFGGSTNDNKSTSNTVVQIVNLNTAAVALTASPNPATVGQSVTFTATASGIMLGATPDMVTFYDGSNSIGSASLNAEGTASLSTNSLSIGTHTITAILSATATHTAATSAPVSEVIQQPGFSFTGNSITFLTGKSGTGDLQLASLEGFTGNVAITCNPPFPANYTCTLQFSSVSLSPNLSTVFTYTLKPSDTASAVHANRSGSDATRIFFASLLPLSLLSLKGFMRKRRTALRTFLGLTFLAILTGAATACGPNQFIAATIPGTYPITFTATGTNQDNSTPITQTLHLTVLIAP
jgi:hypothetical protein